MVLSMLTCCVYARPTVIPQLAGGAGAGTAGATDPPDSAHTALDT
jgi:hypothetical protein